MGFLNNTSITVDAILTKKGRELLARGRNEFQVTKFALADDEVDYRLWDTSHPNGTNYYGAVIENMPLLEPVPDETQALKYKLVSLPKETIKLPILELGVPSLSFGNGAAGNNPGTIVSPGTANSTDAELGYTFIIHDTSVATLGEVTAAPGQTAPLVPAVISADDQLTSQEKVGLTCKIVPAMFTTPNIKRTNLTIVGNQTGATKTITVSVNKTVIGTSATTSS